MRTLELHKTVLVMFSGGIDSTYMLYHYLKNTDYSIHVHHISLRYPSEPRWKEEDRATSNIIEYCKMIRGFTYSQSRFDFGFNYYVGRDSDTQLLVAAKVAPNLKGFVYVALGRQLGDMQSESFALRARNNSAVKLWNALCDSMDAPFNENISREILFPLVDLKLDKKKMIKALPPKLLKMTWSCRKPIKDKLGISISCGKCQPCLDILKAIYKSKIT